MAYLIDVLPITLLVFGVFYLFLGFDETLDKYLNRGTDIEPRIKFMEQRNWIRDTYVVSSDYKNESVTNNV